MARIGFIGLGTMGGPMAGHLVNAGHHVVSYNRSAERANDWLANYPKGRLAASPLAAAEGAEFVFTCVGNDDDLRDVTLGKNGVLAGMRSGAMLIDHTTASADIAQQLACESAQRKIKFLDAPVSGGQAGAESGALSIMVGGNEADFQVAQGLLEPYSKAIQWMGPAGSGQLTKMVNQICVAGLLQGLAEGLNFGQKSGLDMQRVLKVISAGAAASWQMENRAETMLEDQFDFGFAIDWMRKDLDICLQQAEKIGAVLPCTADVNQRYADLQEMGGGRWDTSALIKRL